MADFTSASGADIFSSAATAGLVPPNASATPQANPQEIINKLIASAQPNNGQVNGQPLTTFGAQPPQANIPPAAAVNAPQVPQGSFQSKGEAQRANKQALFNNVATIVKQGVDTVHQRKVAQVSQNVTRLLGALDGLNEAKASGNQEAIKHNMDIINMMLDPTTPEGKKRIKELQKAFNVNLLGESKDTKSPEYQGFLKAYKQYGEDKAAGKAAMNPIAQRLMAAMPQRAQLNPALAGQAAAVKAGIIPDANATLAAQVNAQNSAADRANVLKQQEMKDATDIKVAQMTASQIEGGGTVVTAPPGVKSLTGLVKVQYSKDGKTMRIIPDVIMPAVLPSEHEGNTTLAIPDASSPTGVSYASVPTHTATSKTIPGQGKVGQGGVISPTTQSGLDGGKHKETHEAAKKAQEMGLPRGSVIMSPKALTPAQIDKIKDNVQALDATVERLKDLRQYTDLYQSMIAGGRVKLVNDPRTGQRIIGSFLPATDEEKKAASAWGQSAEYMNTIRQTLNAQGFRSIPAYDNMLALRGQIWQDKVTLNKTLDDSIKMLTDRSNLMKQQPGVKESIDKMHDTTDGRDSSDKDNPGGLKF